MAKTKKKILFLPIGIGLAHIGRLLVLAKELKKRGYEVVFGAGGQAPEVIKRESLPYRLLPELPRKALTKARKADPVIYTLGTIERFVEAELKLYEQEAPDLVIADARATAKISTRIAKLPLVTLNNVNVTKFYDYSRAGFPIPSQFMGRFIPQKIIKSLEWEWVQKNVLSKIGTRLVETILLKELLKFNIVLLKNNRRPLKSLYELFMGDLTLLCDAPFFRPTKKLPAGVTSVGPIFWEPKVKLPSWAKRISTKKPEEIIYLTAAGTGDDKLFTELLGYLTKQPLTVIATTGNAIEAEKVVKKKWGNAYITQFLPGSWAMEKSELVIFFGGNSTAYQALASGTPQIVLPTHVDQQDNARQLKRLGTAITLSPHNLSKRVVSDAISKVLEDKSFKKRAEKYKDLMGKYNGPRNAAQEIEKFLFTFSASLSQATRSGTATNGEE